MSAERLPTSVLLDVKAAQVDLLLVVPDVRLPALGAPGQAHAQSPKEMLHGGTYDNGSMGVLHLLLQRQCFVKLRNRPDPLLHAA